MIVSRWRPALAALVALVGSTAGCGGASSLPGEDGYRGGAGDNPLAGTWVGGTSVGGSTETDTLTLDGDGTATLGTTLADPSGSACTGTVTISGVKWTSTSSSLTLSSGLVLGIAHVPGHGQPGPVRLRRPARQHVRLHAERRRRHAHARLRRHPHHLRSPGLSAADVAHGEHGRTPRRHPTAGSSTPTRAPPPSRFAAYALPPCASAIRFTSESPSPRLPCSLRR